MWSLGINLLRSFPYSKAGEAEPLKEGITLNEGLGRVLE